MWENLWGIGGVWERRGSRGESERIGVGVWENLWGMGSLWDRKGHK